MRFCLLGSGSSGNAVLVISPKEKILIDNGLSYRQLVLRMAELGETLEGLSAIFVTHEHGDHVNGIGTLARKTPAPVHLTQDTYASLPARVGKLPSVRHFEAGESIQVGETSVQSFSVSHDAADPVSFVVCNNGAKLGFAHDLGHPSALVRRRLEGSQALVLEANYCPEMLRNGPYPPVLQQRIRGRHGHLSNYDMSQLLGSLMHENLRLVVLVHISEENNQRRLAFETADRIVGHRGVEVFVARQDRPTRMFEVLPSC